MPTKKYFIFFLKEISVSKSSSYVKYSLLHIFLFNPEYNNNALGCKKIFQTLPFYNTFIEKPKIKKSSNIKLLQELPFYDELSIIKNNNAFSGYARSYKIEIVDKKIL